MTWWDDAVGLSHSVTRAFDAGDLTAYRALVGDETTDAEVPEPLIAGLFSKILGVDLPGPGTNYLKQRLTVQVPARVDELLTATVVIDRVVPDKRLVYLTTTCTGEDGRVIANGSALVLGGGVPAA